jgi:tetratricopeptide (TPR) repeat protein
LSSLGSLTLQRSDPERARDFYRQALEVFPRPEDRRHPIAIAILGDYAVAFSRSGDYVRAEALQQEALPLAREVVGPQTMTVANILNNLATSQANLGHHRDAEETFRSSFDIHLALLGSDHWQTRNVARNIGRVLELQRRYAEALPWMDRARPQRSGAVDEDARGVQRAQRAQVLFRVGRREEALAEAAAAVSGLERYRGADAPMRLAQARVILGRMRVEAGQPRAGEEALEAASAWYDEEGAEAPRRAEASCELARARLLQQDSAEERRRLAECLPAYRAWGLADVETLRALDSPRFRALGSTPRP